MPLNSIRAFRIGLLFEKQGAYVFVIAVSLKKYPQTKIQKSFSPLITNQQIQNQLERHFVRYSLIFSHKKNNQSSLQLNLFLQGTTPHTLVIKAKQALSSLQTFFKGLGIELIIQDSRQILDKLKANDPQTISFLSPGFFQIQGKTKTTFLTITKLNFTLNDERKDFSALLKDFFSLFYSGRIIIDVYRVRKNETDQKAGPAIAILVVFESENKEKLIHLQKKFYSLVSLLGLSGKEGSIPKVQHVTIQEFKQNITKILLNQGWAFNVTESNDWLDFIEFFKIIN
ncbi:MAG: hypothetical protein K9W42_03345 [Candidatus Heimdallarchaeota archaeon]|nr:hypothetical protein [Candidatus Heimdallarchaeota archaeon]